MNITRGVINRAQKVAIYGPEGIGKSTLAAQFPDPLFIDTEGGTSNMDIARLDKPSSWQMLLQEVEDVKINRPCKTLVIDTIDWAERLCIQFVCAKYNKKGIEDFGYGNGYTYLGEELGRLLDKLQELIDGGINVVLTAHAQIKSFTRPDELGAYDRWELKLGNKKTIATTAGLVKEWVDMLLFCNYEIAIISTNDKGKKKAQGGKRMMYTTHHPAWDAKNRFQLPEQIEMNFAGIAPIFANQIAPSQPSIQVSQTSKELQQTVEESQMIDPANVESLPNAADTPNFSPEPVKYEGIPQDLLDLMQANNVLPQEIQRAIGAKGYYTEDTPISAYEPDFVKGVLVAAWPQVFEMIQQLKQKQKF
ncbi:MAG: AAA family ATPase [Enterococcaceae bacterium]|nr:AAA family ATPase [Enterococcaceae bacterium]